MATLPPFPAVMQREGKQVTVRSAYEYWSAYYAGYLPLNAPVPVDENDGFSDAAVAALIDNMSSKTFAALMRRLVAKKDLTLSETPPVSPARGTVWVDTSPS